MRINTRTLDLSAALAWALFIFSTVLFGGCSGGKDQLTSLNGASIQPVKLADPMTPGAALTEDQLDVTHLAIRQALIDARVDPTLPRRTKAQKILEAIRKAPNIFDAGLTTAGDVWIRLTDGTPVSISTDPRQEPSPTDPNPLDSPLSFNRGAQMRETFFATADRMSNWFFPQVEAQWAPGYDIPQSDLAVLIEMDGLAPHSSAAIASMLGLKNYRVTSRKNPKTTQLRTMVNGLGVFWFSGHGTYFTDSSGLEQWALVAGDKLNTPKCQDAADICAANRADRDAGRIFISFDANTQSGGIALRGGFVSKYWSFSKNSFVVLDACGSTNESWANQEMWNAMKKVGVGAYMGWNAPVLAGFAEKAVTYFFDRVLGANAYMPLTPPQRPFSTAEVMSVMKSKGRDVDPNGARLTLTQFSSDDVILQPSIRNMNVDEDKQTLELYGEFGKTPGTIEINGTPLNGNWGNNRIVVSLPASGTNSKGQVLAHVNQFQSNQAPLTEWVGQLWGRDTFDDLMGTPGPYFEANCSKLRVRADIHVYREKPEDEARAGWMDDAHGYSPEIPFTHVNSETTCAHSSGGSGIKNNGPTENIKYEFSGGAGTAVWTKHADANGDNFLLAVGRIRPKERQITVNMNTRTPGYVTLTTTQVPTCPSSGCAPPTSSGFGQPSIGHVGYEMNKRLYQLDANYNLPQTSDTFRITFEQPDLTNLPPGIQLPPIDWGALSNAPTEKGEIRWNLNADQATVPTPDTPG